MPGAERACAQAQPHSSTSVGVGYRISRSRLAVMYQADEVQHAGQVVAAKTQPQHGPRFGARQRRPPAPAPPAISTKNGSAISMRYISSVMASTPQR